MDELDRLADHVKEGTVTTYSSTSTRAATSAAAAITSAVALAWVAVALVHPTSFTGDDNRMWMIVHVAQLTFAPVVALGMLILLRGIDGPAPTVGRIAVVLWAAWFAGFDAVAGIATGILAGGDAADMGIYLYDHGLVQTLGWVAPVVWLLAVIPTGIALKSHGAHSVIYRAVLLSGLVSVHAGLPAAVGFAALTVAFWIGIRGDSRSERGTP